MILESLFFLFGMNAWEKGLEKISTPPPDMEIAEILPKWDFVPEISAEAVVVMEKKSAQVVFEKNMKKELPMASLTKMMTAVMIAEKYEGKEVVEIPRVAAETEGSTMKLELGEKISIENLLFGLLLNSGNDAAVALAMFDKNSLPQFVEKMNATAESWRLRNTHFTNPYGFDAQEHFSSAFDLALIAKKLLNIKLLEKMVNTKEKEVFSENGKISHLLVNTNELLDSIFPIYGVKTGTTDAAGECLALLVKSPQHDYIVIILGSKDRYADSKAILWKLLFAS